MDVITRFTMVTFEMPLHSSQSQTLHLDDNVKLVYIDCLVNNFRYFAHMLELCLILAIF